MLDINVYGKLLEKYGFIFFSGVPCSFLKSLINYSINNFNYVIACNEGDAVAICSGAYLGGKKSAVLLQNSGLTNALSPLTSLNYIFKIPVLGFVSLRGEPGLKDEPQHELLGEITADILETCRLKYQYLSDDIKEAEEQLKYANEVIEKNLEPFFFIVRKESFSEEKLVKTIEFKNKKREIISKSDLLPEHTRLEVLEVISSLKDNSTVFLASTGMTGRELFELGDTENNLYMVGSMGCISPMALGLALVKPDKKVIAIDGDGALLMRMGTLTTNGFYAPPNMLHILLDNGCHDSTGGQDTLSRNVDFTSIAYNSGYDRSIITNDLNELNKEIKQWKKNPKLTFINIKIKKGSKKNLGRPTIKPFEVKERLIKFLNK